jgi:ABC-type sulfate/molybdate transport systems ATPase subunit
MAVLVVSHDVELVAQLAHRIVVLDQGRVATEGTPREVLSAGSLATQIAQLFPGSGWLTVDEAVAGLWPNDGSR